MRTNHLRGPLTYICHSVKCNCNRNGEGDGFCNGGWCVVCFLGVATHCLCGVSHQEVVLAAIQVVGGEQIKQTA